MGQPYENQPLSVCIREIMLSAHKHIWLQGGFYIPCFKLKQFQASTGTQRSLLETVQCASSNCLILPGWHCSKGRFNKSHCNKFNPIVVIIIMGWQKTLKFHITRFSSEGVSLQLCVCVSLRVSYWWRRVGFDSSSWDYQQPYGPEGTK